MKRKKVVMVTGASVGLGLALAKQLLEEKNYHCVFTARSGSLARFEEEGIVESDSVWIRSLDVTQDQERKGLIEEIEQKLDGVDVLINNAGVSYRSVVEHVREEDRLTQMDVNFRSPMELIRLVLPGMRKKQEGRIINVSSVGGMMAMPTMAVYSASKFALEGATEALWYEVKPWNVFVSLVQPGFIRSPSFQKVRYTELSQNSTESDGPYSAHYHYMTPFIAKTMGLAFATPEKVARKIIKTMKRKRPPLRVPATIDAILFSLFRRMIPRQLYHIILYYSLPKVRKWGKNHLKEKED